MGKLKKIVLGIIACVFVFSGCNQDDKGVFFKFDAEDIVHVTDYDFFKKDNGMVFIEIKKEEDFKRLLNKTILSMEIKLTDTILKGVPIKIAFSREMQLQPFIYIIDHKTGYLVPEEINNKNLLYIGLEEDLKPLINNGYVVPERLE